MLGTDTTLASQNEQPQSQKDIIPDEETLKEKKIKAFKRNSNRRTRKLINIKFFFNRVKINLKRKIISKRIAKERRSVIFLDKMQI